MLGQDLPFLKEFKEWFHCGVCEYYFQKNTRSAQNNFVSIVNTCKSIIGITFFNLSKTIYVKKYNFLRKWSSEVEENDSNDTLACDDDVQKVVLCTPSSF